MVSNYSMLEHNILDGIESEEGKELFLRGMQRDRKKAEKCAWEWDIIYGFLSKIRQFLEENNDPKVISEVIEFMKERQYRRYFPQGRNS